MTVMCEITDEIENRARRSKNVLISGIPESSANSSKDTSLEKEAARSMAVLKTLGFEEKPFKEVRRV